MAEWTKILASTAVGAVLGFGSSLLLEPVKYRLGIWLTSRRAEKAINRELGRLYSLFEIRAGENDVAYFAAFRLSLTEVYDYYFNTHREAFYSMKWYERYQGFYECYRLIREQVLSGKLSPTKGAQNVQEEFRFRFESGLLDRSIIGKYAEGFSSSDKAIIPFLVPNQNGSAAGGTSENCDSRTHD